MPRIIIYRTDLLAISETFILSQLRALRRFQPHLFGLRSIEGLDLSGIPVHILGSGKLGWIRENLFRHVGYGPSLLHAARECAPALVHAHFATDAGECLPIVENLDVPLVVTLHGSDITASDEVYRGSWRGRRFLSLRSAVQRRASLFLCASDFLRREAEAKGFPSEKLAVHYIGVDTSKLTASTSHEREKTVLFVGRLVAQKGLTNLLRAMARGGESSAPAKLVVIGDGPLRAQHEAEAAELGVRADFLGGQPSSVVYDWMRRCSALVLPSFREGLGIVLCEAIALGLPVVGFASGGIPEVIAEGCGLLAAEGDAGDLGRQIALLLGNPELRGRLAANARRHLLKKFDLATQTQRLEQHYESLVAARSASAVVGTC